MTRYQVVDTAISAGRALQSPQTKMIHYCYEKKEEACDHTIPIYENFLFALALLRTKEVESIQEAKELITKMLAFEVEGDFPKYIHLYPQCHDRCLRVHLLPVFYWTLKEFYTILGDELRSHLRSVVERLLESVESDDGEYPFQVKIKKAAALQAFGELWGNTKRQERGKKELKALNEESRHKDFGTWFVPLYVAETFIALQMVTNDLTQGEWSHFWQHITHTWTPCAFAYCGPTVRDRQYGVEPQSGLYDLFMGQLQGEFAYRVYDNHPFQLQAALIQPCKKEAAFPSVPFEKKGSVAHHNWLVRHKERYVLSALEKKMLLNPSMQKGYHVMRMLWGDRNITHSLVAQGEKATQVTFNLIDDGIELDFLCAEPLPENDRSDDYREVSFFCNWHDGVEVFVNDEKATTFHLNQDVVLKSNDLTVRISFSLMEGEGRFMGHIIPCNRPAQLKNRGERRFDVYDRQIFLRTVKRHSPCNVRAKVTIE